MIEYGTQPVIPIAGVSVTRRGYLRITAGLHRHQYHHRVVVSQALARHPHPVWGKELPSSVDVHHADGDKQHNCLQNLLILDHVIHAYLSSPQRCPYTGRYLNQREQELRR